MNPTWAQIASGGAVLMMFALLLLFILKLSPTWEKLKLREMDVRDAEAKVMGEIASALCQVAGSNSQMAASQSQIAGSLNQTAETTRSIAVEQRRATQILEIIESSNSQQQEGINDAVKEIGIRLKALEVSNQDDRTIPKS